MTVIRILLIVGLVYIGLQQKKESTRNVILVVTGLLAFCMMGKEGLQVYEDTPAVVESCTGTSTAGTCDDGTSTDATTCGNGDGAVDAGGDGEASLDADGVWTLATCGTAGTTVALCETGCSQTAGVAAASGPRDARTTDFADLVTGCNIGTVIGAATDGSSQGSCSQVNCTSHVAASAAVATCAGNRLDDTVDTNNSTNPTKCCNPDKTDDWYSFGEECTPVP
jgi:hypothetical protein